MPLVDHSVAAQTPIGRVLAERVRRDRGGFYQGQSAEPTTATAGQTSSPIIPDLVISEFKVPDISGLDLIRDLGIASNAHVTTLPGVAELVSPYPLEVREKTALGLNNKMYILSATG